MRKTAIILALALVTLITGFGAWGASLPREHTAGSRITLKAPSDSVYRVMRDFAGVPTWWDQLDKVVPMQRREDGLARWKETMGGAEFVLYVAEEEPGTWFVATIDTAGAPPFGGTWRYEVATDAAGATVVTITEAGWVNNPFFRAMMQFSGPQQTVESYLTALGTRFGQTVTPVPVTT